MNECNYCFKKLKSLNYFTVVRFEGTIDYSKKHFCSKTCLRKYYAEPEGHKDTKIKIVKERKKK